MPSMSRLATRAGPGVQTAAASPHARAGGGAPSLTAPALITSLPPLGTVRARISSTAVVSIAPERACNVTMPGWLPGCTQASAIEPLSGNCTSPVDSVAVDIPVSQSCTSVPLVGLPSLRRAVSWIYALSPSQLLGFAPVV
jgi:hypothetical protein